MQEDGGLDKSGCIGDDGLACSVYAEEEWKRICSSVLGMWETKESRLTSGCFDLNH